MQRRKFLSAAAASSLLPLGCAAASGQLQQTETADEKELYEIRIYDMKFGANSQPLTDYLKNALQPALLKAGANHVLFFNEISTELPRKIWAMVSFPTMATYLASQDLSGDSDFQAASATYHQASSMPFNRYESWLLHAFDGLPKMDDPVDGASVFEIRTYEGYSEDALRRKIKMFDDEELPLFYKTGLNPVFFGKMLSGPYRPCLTYMLNFKDMEAHGKAWKAFIQSPEWNEMKGKPIYANTVSNIRNTFLKPM
ncbi:MAG: NIPSNAP family protein [Bacteroidota bacterium]